VVGRAVPVGLVLVAGLAGCGDDGDEAAEPTSTTRPRQTTTSFVVTEQWVIEQSQYQCSDSVSADREAAMQELGAASTSDTDLANAFADELWQEEWRAAAFDGCLRGLANPISPAG
jgi:hypothetical protein